MEIAWGADTFVENFVCRTSNDVARAVAKLAQPQLYGSGALETTEVDHWLTFAIGPLNSKYEVFNAIQVLDKCLSHVTYLANKRLSIADFIVFATLYGELSEFAMGNSIMHYLEEILLVSTFRSLIYGLSSRYEGPVWEYRRPIRRWLSDHKVLQLTAISKLQS